eukprot:gene32550-33315_t
MVGSDFERGLAAMKAEAEHEGAADLLDLKPTTLASRMKALGIAAARARHDATQ